MPDYLTTVADGLAGAFLSGDWEPAAMTRRGQRAVGQRRVWVRELVAATRHAYPDPPVDRRRDLAAFLRACPVLVDTLAAARRHDESPPHMVRWYLPPRAMAEPPWPVVALHSVGDVQDLVGLTAHDLLWLADPRQLGRRRRIERLDHYRYRWARKPRGGIRLIEEPKPRLKHLQRVLLREIIDVVPPHAAAHGFRAGHSVLTYAGLHTGRAVVLHLDLEDFFGSVTAGRVYGIYRRCGYPEPVAHLLTALATNTVPADVWAAAPPSTAGDLSRYRLAGHLLHPHLPQGAPTSPGLANLAAFGLDRRLAGLAVALGLTFSRYADDLALSAPTSLSAAQVDRVITTVSRIAGEEGFRINGRKTTVRRAGERQRLAGVIVNEHPNVDRREYDRLKATLNNAARHGPTSQNRRGHPRFRDQLVGRVAWVEYLNPERGARLRAVLERIDWSSATE